MWLLTFVMLTSLIIDSSSQLSPLSVSSSSSLPSSSSMKSALVSLHRPWSTGMIRGGAFVFGTTSRSRLRQNQRTVASQVSTSFTSSTMQKQQHRSIRGGGGGGDGPIHCESDFPQDVRRALAAVRKACVITQAVQGRLTVGNNNNNNNNEDEDDNVGQQIRQVKQDDTPVTIADYAAQAIILNDLYRYFPDDIFLAEESSLALVSKSNNGREDDGIVDDRMIQQIQQLTGFQTKDELLGAIDIGQSYFHYRDERTKSSPELSPPHPPDRLWVLDPIDGTKGFLRGQPNGQYCVALALLKNGEPTVGILACPNLPLKLDGRSDEENQNDGGNRRNGCIFVAMKGRGCYEIGLSTCDGGGHDDDTDDSSSSSPSPSGHFRRLSITGHNDDDHVDGDDPYSNDPTIARFCVGVEQGFNDPFGTTKKMGETLHGASDLDGEILHCIRMDSQVKYGVIARGDAEFYVRLPRDHKDNIWDVAAGALCLEEVGGCVTDTTGRPLDYSVGAKLPTVGILGARKKRLHDVLLDTYRKVMEDDQQES